MRDLKIIIKKKILEELSEITDIVITKADKGRKIVIKCRKIYSGSRKTRNIMSSYQTKRILNQQNTINSASFNKQKLLTQKVAADTSKMN